jgi:hypothetical protein
MMMDGVLAMKDPEALKDAFKKASDQKPSAQVLLAQRVSFVFASVSEKSHVSKDQVRRAILAQTGTEPV